MFWWESEESGVEVVQEEPTKTKWNLSFTKGEKERVEGGGRRSN